jgi:hypothetical protein
MISLGPYGKEGFSSSNNNNNKLLPIILLVASAAAIVVMFYPSVLWSILFLFISTANLQFAVVTKKAKAAQGKKALECRGSPLANAKEFFAKSEEVRHLVTAT